MDRRFVCIFLPLRLSKSSGSGCGKGGRSGGGACLLGGAKIGGSEEGGSGKPWVLSPMVTGQAKNSKQEGGFSLLTSRISPHRLSRKLSGCDALWRRRRRRRCQPTVGPCRCSMQCVVVCPSKYPNALHAPHVVWVLRVPATNYCPSIEPKCCDLFIHRYFSPEPKHIIFV